MLTENKKEFLVLFWALCAVSVALFFCDAPVFAYSASITTDNSTVLNVSVLGTGTSIVEKSINVASDCRSGYSLVASTTESSDLYLNGNNSGTAAFTAVNGTSTLANSTNKWGYTLTSNPSSSTVFSPLSTTASTLKTPSETASPSSDINDTFPIYYGVKVDDTVSPGAYEMGNNGVIVYYLTMDTTCTQYTVAFNANGGTGSVANQNIQAGESTKLTTADTLTAPTGASYTDANNNTINGQADKLWAFWGWNTAIDGTGDWYKDKEAVEDLANAGSTITLYAQWKQATLADLTAGTQVGTEKIINHNLMQDMSPEACYNSDITTAANAPAATLLDYRGKITTGENPELPESYTVSKLPDGLCWMTKNLNLGRDSGGPNGNGTITLTPDDTDITSNFTLPAADTTAYAATTTYFAKVRLTNSSGTNANGAYYSWNAATTITSATNVNPTTSICPKNWDLPTDTMYTNLSAKAAYSASNPTTAAPSSFLIDGGMTNGATFYQTGYGYYWTSVFYNNSNAWGVRINAGSVAAHYQNGVVYGGYRYLRKNIRCVAGNGNVTINYNGNGSDGGSTANQTNIEVNSKTVLSTNGFTRTGYGFTGWNTAADGSGTAIAEDATISTLNFKPGETVNLYAQWVPQYTINYVHNCKQWAASDTNCTNEMSSSTLDEKINLDTNGDGSGTLKNYDAWTDLANWKIKEWTTNADGTGTAYPINSTYAVTSASAGDNVTLYAHWIPTYTVQFDGNGATNVNGMGSTDGATGAKSVKFINVAEGEAITLLASNFKRAGYGFAGWSTNPNATVSSGDKIYGPMEVIEAPTRPTNGTIVTMYAVWVQAEKDNNNKPVYLQDWSGCSDLTAASFNTNTGEITAGSVIALTDKRDDEVYTIAKLADNKCWMVENLRLNNQYTMGQNKNDSSVTNESLAQGYGGTPGTYGSFVGLATSETIASSSNSNSVYKAFANPPVDTYNPSTSVLEDIGSVDNVPNRFPRYNNNNTQNLVDNPSFTRNYGNAVSSANSGTYPSASLYSKGNYYTWNAALANTNHYTSINNTDAAGKTSENVNTSICPKGWHLPSSSSATKEYGFLSKSYGGTGGNQGGAANSGDIMSRRFRTFPNNFIFSLNNGTEGRYWGRSNYNSTNGYLLYFSATNINPNQSNAKWNGYSIRCIKDSGIGVVETMQEIAGMSANALADLKSSMVEGEQYQLKDSRDQKLYTVSKLADGRIWMTQNLDLDIDSSVTYTNANTDIGYNTSTGTYGTASWTPSSSTYANGTTTWNDSNTTPESYDPGDVYWNGTTSNTNDWNNYFGTCSGWTNCNETINPISNYLSSTGDSQYHLGNYYNWTAAVASNNSSSLTSGNAERSICPVGWTLPTGGNTVGSFEYLYTQYGWNSNTYALSNNKFAYQAPMYFALGGLWDANLIFVGYGGGFWTQTAADANYAGYSDVYTSYYEYGTVHPTDPYWRDTGVSVRCVTRR